MNQKQQKQLDKIFRLYNDNAAKETEESNAALNKLRTLCEKYKVDFDAYIASKSEIPAKNEAENSAPEAENNTASNDVSKPRPTLKSRRAFIIEALQQGIWDRKTLAEAVAALFPQYQDLKRNAGAVTGTVNDLRQNKSWDIRCCDDGRLWVKK
jgi:hypothetical protein